MLTKGVKKMDTILFGIRKDLMEDESKREELKSYLKRNKMLPLTILIDIKEGVANCTTFFPAENRSFDVTKLPEVNSQKWLEALRQLVSSQNATDVVWFPSADRALYYIETL